MRYDAGLSSRDASCCSSVEAANEIFTVYFCTSSDAQSSERRWLKRTGQIIMMRLRLKKESGRNEVIDSCNSRGINKPLACFSHVPPRRQSNVVTTLHHIVQLCFRGIVFCERLYCERATETPNRRPNSDPKHSKPNITCSPPERLPTLHLRHS